MLSELYQTILERKRELPTTSYTASLFIKGEDEILKKIGEESVEVILAAKSQGNARLVEEVADLTYHVLVLLAAKDISPIEITVELEKRRK